MIVVVWSRIKHEWLLDIVSHRNAGVRSPLTTTKEREDSKAGDDDSKQKVACKET